MRASPPPEPFIQARHRRRSRAAAVAGGVLLFVAITAVAYLFVDQVAWKLAEVLSG
ncbi:MAG: hypothetical protein AB7O78_01595 [Thermoleophilia bacterium]